MYDKSMNRPAVLYAVTTIATNEPARHLAARPRSIGPSNDDESLVVRIVEMFNLRYRRKILTESVSKR